MKPTLLLAMLSMVSGFPAASAATELEALRARCIEQERQIEILQDQLQKLQPAENAGTKATVTPPAAPAAPAAPTIYVVKPGDFLAKIARKNHCSEAALAKANGLKPSSMIHPGQKLKLPVPASAAKAAPTKSSPSALAGKTHKIQEGETYSSIGRKYGISVQSLIAANPSAKATALRPGQVIRLSADAPATTPQSEVRRLPSASPVPLTPATAATPPPVPAPAPKPAPVPTPEPPPAEVAKTVEDPPASSPTEEMPPSAPEKKIRSVTIDSEMTYAEFAAKHGTDISRLNDLNGLDLTNSTVLAKGSELYVPAQP